MTRGKKACPMDGKHTFNTWRQAEKSATRKKDPIRIYWCPCAGGYHLTSLELDEYSRRQQLKLQKEEGHECQPRKLP